MTSAHPDLNAVSCRQQGHEGSKALNQLNRSVVNLPCQLMQFDVYNCHKMVADVVTSSNVKLHSC